MVGSVEIDPLVLLASFVVALVLPAVTVYLLAVYNTHRRIAGHETEERRRLADVEDRLTRLERPEPRSVNGDEPPHARSGTLLRDPEPPAEGREEAHDPAMDPEPAAGGPTDPSQSLDPWMEAFSGCLRGREVLDRDPVPGRAPSADEGKAGEDES